MRVDVVLDEKDYLEHIKFYYRSTPGGIALIRRTERNLWVAIVLTPILIGMVMLLAGRPQDGIFMALATLVILAALFPFFRKRMRAKIVENSLAVLRSDKNALYFLPATLEITPEYHSRETELSYVRIGWKAVENIYETPTHLFIFLGSAMGANTIPLRCFNSPQDAAAFAMAARQYLEQAKAAG
jgi:hypothetical protein